MARSTDRWLVLFSVAVLGLVLLPGSARAQSCQAGTESDFNGDGARDIAIADPAASVNGLESAGRAHIVYGGSAGSQTISRADSSLNGGPTTGGRFGFALAAVDYNQDGCTDLVVGSPFEMIGADAEAGLVDVVYGSPSGLGSNGSLQLHQDTPGMPGAVEAGDRFGYSVAAGKTAAGAAYLVVGVPGEDLANPEPLPDAGAFHYIRGSTMLIAHQDSAGVFGIAEAGDQFGYAVAASRRHVAAGGPAEEVDFGPYAGTVGVFTHDVAAGTIGGWDQHQPGDSGLAEPDDWCGSSLAMVDYVPPGGSTASSASLLAVACPGEALGEVPTAGRVVLLQAAGSTVSELASVNWGTPGMTRELASGDYFGWSVQVANRSPGSAVGWDDLVVAAGVPGEDLAGLVDGGGVQTVSAVGPPGDHDTWLDSGDLTDGAWAPRDDARAGQFTGATPTHLYIGDPYGSPPAVYAVPWQNLIDGASDPVRVYQPGADGLPSDGYGLFGAAIV